jgi:hypothetical protein
MLAGCAGACIVLLATCADATTICRWVDSTGRTRIAEVVPEPYRKVAVCTDSQRYELTAEQRRAADQKSAADQVRARRLAAKPAADAASASRAPAKAASQAAGKRPTEIVTDATDCATAWRVYNESVECFAPYRTTRGATKAEAFDKCNVVMSPEPRCGPPSD